MMFPSRQASRHRWRQGVERHIRVRYAYVPGNHSAKEFDIAHHTLLRVRVSEILCCDGNFKSFTASLTSPDPFSVIRYITVPKHNHSDTTCPRYLC
jgi:hypothetical protein